MGVWLGALVQGRGVYQGLGVYEGTDIRVGCRGRCSGGLYIRVWIGWR